MLASLVSRINLFMETTFKSLITLCISKQQENLLADVRQQLDATI